MDDRQARTISSEIGCCPICAKQIFIEEIPAMTEVDGRWLPDEVHINCVSEPAIGSKKWQEWHNWHWSTPYIDWLPIRVRVEKWMQQPEQRERVKVICGE